MLRGEIPEFLPRYDMFGWCAMFSPFERKKNADGYEVDEFGMEHTTNASSMGGMMPVPGRILVRDITKWRDVIKTPDLSNLDWAQIAEKEMAKKDPVNNPVIVFAGDFFMKIMNFMSFSEGLCALQEEPEEVYALLDWLCEYYLKLLDKKITYLKPDILSLADDVAAAQQPFISVDMYRRLILPHHKRLADFALDRGLTLIMHCCGKCESFIDDWLDMGVSGWEPAQVSNDLKGIKKKYGSRLAIMGGWDNTGPISYPDTPDDVLLAALKEYVDTFAPGGRFAYMAMVMSENDDPDSVRKVKLSEDFYQNYARLWYKNNA
jgi:hypothetical protein